GWAGEPSGLGAGRPRPPSRVPSGTLTADAHPRETTPAIRHSALETSRPGCRPSCPGVSAITGRRHVRASSSTSRSSTQVKDPTEPPYLVLRQEISLRRRPHRRGRRPMPGWRHRRQVSRRRRALLHTGVRTASWTPRPTLFFSGRRISERWRRRPTRGSADDTPGDDRARAERTELVNRARRPRRGGCQHTRAYSAI